MHAVVVMAVDAAGVMEKRKEREREKRKKKKKQLTSRCWQPTHAVVVVVVVIDPTQVGVGQHVVTTIDVDIWW